MKKTNDFFEKGKISVILDGGAGSSGKGKAGAFMMKNSDNVKFACNTFFPQASHTVVEIENGKRVEYVYKQLNSCAHFHEKIDKIYIGHGSVIDIDSLLKEIEMVGLPDHKLGISPVATILQPIDTKFEEGKTDFDGKESGEHSGTIKFGSTCSGVGAARARRVLRRPNVKLARDIEALQKYLCDVPNEIMDRLDKGQSGLLEVAQGFQLSYGLDQFYPYVTSRNCSVVAGFDDMMIPASYLGNVCINFRTFPIRIHSYKYISTGENPRHLTWDEVQEGKIPHNKIESNSGDWYDDQEELSWEKLTLMSGSPKPLMECTTLTKLPRRVATFSKKNLEEAIRFNQTPGKIWISVNFLNYVSWNMNGVTDFIDTNVSSWLDDNIKTITNKYPNVSLKMLGTGALTDETILLER